MELFVNVLAGFVLVPILNVIKKYTGLKDAPMLWITVLVSLIGGFFVALVSGQLDLAMLSSPELFLMNGAKVAAQLFASAQVLYKTLAYTAKK